LWKLSQLTLSYRVTKIFLLNKSLSHDLSICCVGNSIYSNRL